MAILISGMPCRICGGPLTQADDLVFLPPFVENELDPLFVFSDAVFHQHCLQEHPSGRQVLERFQEFEAANAPGARACTVCGQLITDPDEFFGLGRLTGDTAHPLHRHSYARMHKSCLVQWKPLGEVLQFLQTERNAARNRGRAIDHMIKVLQRAQRAARGQDRQLRRQRGGGD